MFGYPRSTFSVAFSHASCGQLTHPGITCVKC